MNPVVIFVLVVGPMTALLIWVVACEIRGVSAFTDRPAPAEGELDAIGRWVLAGAFVAVVVSAYAYGGILAVLAILSLIAVLTTLTALVWTIGQDVRQWFHHLRAVKEGTVTPSPLAPLHLRFTRNFRHTIIRIPLYFASLG